MACNAREYSLSELVDTDIRTLIPAPIVEQVLCKEPFTAVPGVLNIRDLGIYASPFISQGIVYRCGALSSLTDEGKIILAKDLGIRLIMDLRSKTETSRDPEPNIEGVKSLWLPCIQQPLAVDLNDFVGDDGKKGYLKMYDDVLNIYKPSFKAVLEHLRDEGGPVLFHCSAGKDRTGMLAAIIMGLAGCSHNTIAQDYALSRIGIEPQRKALIRILSQWRKDWHIDTPGMLEFSAIKGSVMKAVMKMIEEKYDGMEGYAKHQLGFSNEEIEQIKANLKR
ncbi:hypothetical protein AOQ84DRAFT_435640 [Glonium stellatum]|uniref:Tyrosine specific protein phosphatases domain-containing protein n=1 Tax=Glonium stellatum TaxID=574774 RepID=A0A8E2FCI5_9PEZI|nr:hypothetical protein AOQ84DRAFT_435640 [Glonium stellatum]